MFPYVDTLVVCRDDSALAPCFVQSEKENSNHANVPKTIKLILKGGKQPQAKPKLRNSLDSANNQNSTTSSEEVTMTTVQSNKATSSTLRKLVETVSDTQVIQKIPVITPQQRTFPHTDVTLTSDDAHGSWSVEK